VSKRNALLRQEPEETRQPDLFFCDVADVSLKDTRHAMVFPFLSLSKRPRFEPMEYKNPETGDTVLVSGSKPYGIATIWDFDVMIWLFGQMAAEMNDGRKPGRKLGFHAYDCLQGIKRSTGGEDYKRLENALERLKTTAIQTNVDDRREMRIFGWLDEARIQRDKAGRAAYVEVILSDWVYQKITDPKNILTLHRNYFLLTGGIAKQLYRTARKMAGQREFKISLNELANRSGVEDAKHFAQAVRKIAADDESGEANFPEYEIRIAIKGRGRSKSEMVSFRCKHPAATPAKVPPLSPTTRPFEIDDDSYNEAKRYCRASDLDFHELYTKWQDDQWTKHFQFIIKNGRPPLKHPGKAFLGYLRGVTRNTR
jgi:plasmid replication initiation protein